MPLLLNQHQIHSVQTPQELHQMMQVLENQTTLSLDLEFDRNRYHYGIHLCLMQIAAQGQCFLVDTLALKTQLQPVFQLLESSTITKILHSAGEDIRILAHFGCQLQHIYDTSLALHLLNYETFSLSDLLKQKLALEVDKKLQKSNWHTRPLSPQHLVYAASDVVYLQELKTSLDAELKQQGYQAWHEEECLYLLNKAQHQDEDEEQFDKGFAHRLSEQQRYIYQQLLEFREQQAQHLDCPPGMLLSNKNLKHLIPLDQPSFEQWIKDNLQRNGRRAAQFLQSFVLERKRALRQAEAQGLSSQTPNNRLSSEEVKRRQALRMDFFKPIQNLLHQDLGLVSARYLLSNRLVDELLNGSLKLSDWERLCPSRLRYLRQAADALDFDLSPYF